MFVCLSFDMLPFLYSNLPHLFPPFHFQLLWINCLWSFLRPVSPLEHRIPSSLKDPIPATVPLSLQCQICCDSPTLKFKTNKKTPPSILLQQYFTVPFKLNTKKKVSYNVSTSGSPHLLVRLTPISLLSLLLH